MQNTQRDLLGIAGLSDAVIAEILQRAEAFAHSWANPELRLKRRILATLFYENSTRTRASFEIAAKRLGAEIVNLDIATSSAQKGESLLDTARNIAAMGVDAIILRHSEAGTPQKIAAAVDCAVINAGDGTEEHPTQALLDAFTLMQRKGKIAGLTVTICGDIRHSRVARSNLLLLRRLGANVRLVAPQALLPDSLPEGVETFTDLAKGIEAADAVMMLRLQLERMSAEVRPDLNAYQNHWQLNRAALSKAKPDAIIMHPGPLNRQLEITDELADDPERSVILQQVQNGIFIRMAVLDTLLGNLTRGV
jgi:aspartate carbamoyltransferase catalytic subunit